MTTGTPRRKKKGYPFNYESIINPFLRPESVAPSARNSLCVSESNYSSQSDSEVLAPPSFPARFSSATASTAMLAYRRSTSPVAGSPGHDWEPPSNPFSGAFLQEGTAPPEDHIPLSDHRGGAGAPSQHTGHNLSTIHSAPSTSSLQRFNSGYDHILPTNSSPSRSIPQPSSYPHPENNSNISLARRLSRRGFLNVPPGQGFAGLGPGSGLNASRPASESSSMSLTDYKLCANLDAVNAVLNEPEDDDWLHDVRDPKELRTSNMIFTARGCMNIGFLAFLALALLMLFAGWPVLVFVNKLLGNSIFRNFFAQTEPIDTSNIGPTWIMMKDAAGRPEKVTRSPLRGLIDPDTPQSAMTRLSADGTRRLKLVFSDEFNLDDRTFFEGDDPFWTAVDLHYWGTSDYEYYTPLGATTKGGALRITLSEQPINNLNFKSAMLQSWNKLCMQGGLLEVSLMLPGDPKVPGYWPAVWTMSNLGRAGFGATNEGMWPYNYDSCDVGTMPNQTYLPDGKGGPLAAEMTGVYVETYGPALSFQPGQKLSRCTCASSTDHPGPKHPDGSWYGRGASELDVLEATSGGIGRNSMSLQTAPYNSGYNITPGYTRVYDSVNSLNTYTGAAYQQAVSAMIQTPQTAYQHNGGEYAMYGVEWSPHYRQRDPYVTWLTANEPSWTLHAGALGPDNLTEIGQRLIPPEPMYVIFNLGISSGFSAVKFDELKFPGIMSVDYVRIYQEEGQESLSCDGAHPEMPTVDYIKKHAEAYWNANLTIWRGKREDGAYGKVFPPHAMKGECE